jgi:hypothetical protein
VNDIAWWWRFLGLKPGASKAEIKAAYHRLAKLLHRDHGGTDEDMVRLNEAYHLALTDNGPAFQEPPRQPKAKPRHEPPRSPPPRPKAAPQRDPLFTPEARRILRGALQIAIFFAIVAGFMASVSDPKITNKPPQAARHDTVSKVGSTSLRRPPEPWRPYPPSLWYRGRGSYTCGLSGWDLCK